MSDGPSSDGLRRVVIALGANLGDRASTLRDAAAELASIDGVRIVGASHEVESVALTLDGPDADKPRYRNGIVIVETDRALHDLLDALHGIEDAHGRVRVERWGDRTLDLDIVASERIVDAERPKPERLDDAVLTVPHPRAHERDFVLAPWLDADPDAVLDGHGTVADLLRRIGDGTTRVDYGRLVR